MKQKLSSFVLLVFFAAPTFCQSASDLSATYPSKAGEYEVSPSLLMRPEFDRVGQVCRAHIYVKKEQASNTKVMPRDELRQVLNKLAPPNIRGDRTELYADTLVGGNAGWSKINFTNFFFTFYFDVGQGHSIIFVDDLTFDMPATNNTVRFQPASEDDFNDAPNAKEVTMKWRTRVCSNE